jgi:glutathione S-transferase
MSESITVWGMGTVRNLRVHWMLEEMQLPYEFHPVHPRSGQTYSKEFLELNPRHKVPVLKHGETVVTESAAIIEYIAEAFPAPEGVFVPRSAAERAKVNEWSFFVMTEFDAHTLYVIRRHTSLKQLYGEAPIAICAAEAYFHDQLDAISPSVACKGPYLLGELFSTADILLATCLDWAAEYHMPVPRRIYDYHLRCTERPAYQRALKRTFPDSAAMPPMVPYARDGLWQSETSLFSGAKS